MTMTTLVTIFILAIVVEALIEYGTLIFGKTINWKQLAAIAVSILLAFGAQADLFAVVGVKFIIPYLGIILTGIIFSRGANYTSDFIKLLQNKISNTAVIPDVDNGKINGSIGSGPEEKIE